MDALLAQIPETTTSEVTAGQAAQLLRHWFFLDYCIWNVACSLVSKLLVVVSGIPKAICSTSSVNKFWKQSQLSLHQGDAPTRHHPPHPLWLQGNYIWEIFQPFHELVFVLIIWGAWIISYLFFVL